VDLLEHEVGVTTLLGRLDVALHLPADGLDLELRLTSDIRIGLEGPRAIRRTLMKEGETRYVALSWSRHHPGPATYQDAYDRMVWTAHHWQRWLDHGEFPDHPWRTYLQRSALTLKGLSYAPTGALVAAHASNRSSVITAPVPRT
jgi:GH15 family glucan-1,4-alpha-glucosidase